jgi:hypothetical protein
VTSLSLLIREAHFQARRRPRRTERALEPSRAIAVLRDRRTNVTGPGWKIRNNGVKLGCVTASNSRKATVCAWTTAASAAEFPSVGEKGVRDREAQAIDDARTYGTPATWHASPHSGCGTRQSSNARLRTSCDLQKPHSDSPAFVRTTAKHAQDPILSRLWQILTYGIRKTRAVPYALQASPKRVAAGIRTHTSRVRFHCSLSFAFALVR